jgi:hypothetical protein
VRRPYFRVKELGEAVREGVANVEGPPQAPVFHHKRRSISDADQYAVARVEHDLLEQMPYTVVIVDLHVLGAVKYPDQVTVRLRNKALELRTDLLHRGIDVKIFNEIDEEGFGSDDILAKRVTKTHGANTLVALVQQRGDLSLLDEHFSGFAGTRIVCYPSLMPEPTVSHDTRLLRYTRQELDSCNLVAEVHKALDRGINDYVFSIAA